MPDNTVTRAGFGARAAAYIIDRAVLLIPLGMIRLPFLIAQLMGVNDLTRGNFLFRYSVLDVVCWILTAAYFVILTYLTGGTLGKKIMRLQVEKADGAPLRFVDVLYRETVGRFLSGILCIGYLMALVDKSKRAFHDYLCETRVVYAETGFHRVNRAPTDSEQLAESAAADYSVPAAAETQAAEAAAPASELSSWYSAPGRTSAVPGDGKKV